MGALVEISQRADIPDILSLYPGAFPDEELRPLVTALLEHQVLSLVARMGGAIVGHGLFTPSLDQRGALLGPLAVAPAHQGAGLGSALVRAGLQRLEQSGVAQAFVLGDPAYYGRFGFTQENDVQTPCPIPTEWGPAWQSLCLSQRAPLTQLSLPAPWMDPVLWRE